MKTLHSAYKTAVINTIVAFLFFPAVVCAQINLPFQLCSGMPATVSTTVTASSYIWLFDSAAIDFNLAALPSSSAVLPDLGIKPAGTAMLTDNGQWYSFITSHSANTLIRLDYGSSPLNAPVKTTVGSYGTDNQLQGIDIVKDNNTQTWYGFAVNGTQLVRLAFGSSLTNTPAATTINLAAQLAAPHQISLQKAGATWVGFIANKDGAITRLVFNGGLGQAPAVHNLAVNNYYSPAYFTLYQQDGNWYMLVCSYTSGAVSRLSFGTNIQQNNPTVTDLGNFGRISNPRNIHLFTDCKYNQLLGYVLNENGQLVRLNFNGDITSTPSAGTVGTYPNGSGSMSMFAFDHTIYGLRNVPQSNTVHRVAMFSLPASAVAGATTVATYTYSTPGAYKIRLYTNAGQASGGNAYCKDVTVDDCNPNNVSAVPPGLHFLSQNYPNPFVGITSVRYQLPARANASIVIKDMTGRTIKQYTLPPGAKGSIEINTDELSGGVYSYSLISGGKIIATRKMECHR